MDHDGASELLGVYVLDACDEREAAEVAAHVSTCERCTSEVVVLGNLAGWLGASEATSPSAELRSRVLDEGRSTRAADDRRGCGRAMAADGFRGGTTVTPPSTNGERSAPSKDGLETDVLSDAQREHQIKTELAVIYGFSATLEEHWERLSDAERRHAVAAMGRATEQLMEQTERLLHDAKRDVAGQARSVARVDVAELVRTAAARWNEASKTTVVADDSGRPLYAWADSGGLQQVLGHLVDNAIKYSPGGEQISIRVATAGPWVSIYVTDRGVGIPRDINVFAPFQQADSASDTSAGAGLGLHIARTIVEAMGGSLTARRNAHGGSTFAVRVRRDIPAS